MRTERDPAQMATTLHATMEQLDSNLPVNNIEERHAEGANRRRDVQRPTGGDSVDFAGVAGCIAGGTGTLRCVVVLWWRGARVKSEYAWRSAGQRADILRLVLGQGARLTVIGGAAGIVAALALARLMSSLLRRERQ